jgi:hypothetical protein
VDKSPLSLSPGLHPELFIFNPFRVVQSFTIIIHGLYPWLFKVEALQASVSLACCCLENSWYEIEKPEHKAPASQQNKTLIPVSFTDLIRDGRLGSRILGYLH